MIITMIALDCGKISLEYYFQLIMIDNILSIYAPAEIGPPVNLTLLPPAVETITIANVSVPLYGSILAGESKAVEKLLAIVQTMYKSVNNLYSAIGAPKNTPFSEIIRALQFGRFQSVKYEDVKVDFRKIGYTELAAIAKARGVSIFTAVLEEDGNREVQDVVEKYFGTWVELGYEATTGLEMANLILSKTSPVKEIKGEVLHFKGDEILDVAGLSWDELSNMDELLSDDLPYLTVIKFRTGIGSFNLFDYISPTEKAIVLEKLRVELAGVKPSEDVFANANIETIVEETSEEGEPAANLP